MRMGFVGGLKSLNPRSESRNSIRIQSEITIASGSANFGRFRLEELLPSIFPCSPSNPCFAQGAAPFTSACFSFQSPRFESPAPVLSTIGDPPGFSSAAGIDSCSDSYSWIYPWISISYSSVLRRVPRWWNHTTHPLHACM